MEKLEEIEVKVKELENNIKKSNKIPVYITIIIAVISLLGSVWISSNESSNSTKQKRLEVEKDLIITAINGNSREQIKKNIQFFIKAGFFTLSKNSLEKLIQIDSLLPIIDEQKSKELEFSNSFIITSPENNAEIDTSVISIRGTFGGLFTDKDKIIVVAYVDNVFYPMKLSSKIVTNNEWKFNNVVLGMKGTIRLIVCLANEEGLEWFNAKVNNNYEIFSTLHSGIKMLDYVTVIR